MDETQLQDKGPSVNLPAGEPVVDSPSQASSGRASTSIRSIVSLVLGILSLTCCGFFTGIPAFFIGRAEMKGVDQGRVPEASRNLAKIGMILGIIGTGLSILGTLAYLAILALGLSTGFMRGGL